MSIWTKIFGKGALDVAGKVEELLIGLFKQKKKRLLLKWRCKKSL